MHTISAKKTLTTTKRNQIVEYLHRKKNKSKKNNSNNNRSPLYYTLNVSLCVVFGLFGDFAKMHYAMQSTGVTLIEQMHII